MGEGQVGGGEEESVVCAYQCEEGFDVEEEETVRNGDRGGTFPRCHLPAPV